MIKRPYHVEPCDNLGTVEGLKRDRTWVVIGPDGKCVADYDRRADARAEAAARNAEFYA